MAGATRPKPRRSLAARPLGGLHTLAVDDNARDDRIVALEVVPSQQPVCRIERKGRASAVTLPQQGSATAGVVGGHRPLAVGVNL